MKINQNYNTLEKSYLFSRVAEKVAAYKQAHPEAEVISLGIGDVTRPLCRSAVRALISAAEDQGRAETFHGYGPEQGYPFLRRAIREYYGSFGVSVDEEEIFVSDGAKSDIGNILDLFSEDNTVLIPDPVYPVYRDTNQMAGRKIVYMRATKENGFLPMRIRQWRRILFICAPRTIRLGPSTRAGSCKSGWSTRKSAAQLSCLMRRTNRSFRKSRCRAASSR